MLFYYFAHLGFCSPSTSIGLLVPLAIIIGVTEILSTTLWISGFAHTGLQSKINNYCKINITFFAFRYPYSRMAIYKGCFVHLSFYLFYLGSNGGCNLHRSLNVQEKTIHRKKERAHGKKETPQAMCRSMIQIL